MKTSINLISVKNRFRKELGDLSHLSESIKTIGLLHPVVIDSSYRLIAGERRIEAHKLLGLTEIEARIVHVPSLLQAEFDENELCKGFTVSERVAIARAIEEEIGNRRGQRTDLPIPDNNTDVFIVESESREELPQNFAEVKGKETAEIAAERAGFGNKETYRQAKKVVNEGTEELVDKVDKGEISVSLAATVAELPKTEQAEIVAKGEKEIIAAANSIKKAKKEKKRQERQDEITKLSADIPSITERYALYLGDFSFALSEIKAESVDWIITDPPYPKEFITVFNQLSRVADHSLKPGGLALVMVGQSYLPEIIACLSEKLTYHWTLAYLTPGGQSTQLFQRKVNTFWKPVLVFSKGEYPGNWFGDVCQSKTNDNDKEHHHWGQSESGMYDLTKRFVKPGDVVLDPFLGGGTTAIVALKLGCEFIGYDIDTQAIDATRARLASL